MAKSRRHHHPAATLAETSPEEVLRLVSRVGNRPKQNRALRWSVGVRVFGGRKHIHPALSLRLAPGVRLNASLDHFWRYSIRDGVYALNGMLIRAAGDNRAR